MDKKLWGNVSLASMFTVMLVGGLIDNGKPPISNASAALAPQTSNDIESDGNLAFSTIFPAFVPHKLPVPDIVDIAVEAGLGKAVPIQGSPDESNHPENIENQDESMLSPDRQPHKQPDTGTNTVLKDSLRFLSRVSAVASLQSREFANVLQPAGFHRPDWQTIGAGVILGDRVEPFVVMLDPGHGGSDPGAEGHNGLLEKDLTLDIANRVKLFLTELDHIDVQLTRNHDYGLSRQARVSAIKRSEADMVISLHFNHLPQSDINLVESYYAGPENIHESHSTRRKHPQGDLYRTAGAATAPIALDLSFTQGSKRLAHALQQRIFAEVSYENAHVQNAGVKQETLFVLTQSYTPSVLLEISCLSYTREAERLTKEDYRNRLAAALVDGIRNYHDSLQNQPLNKPGDLGA